MRHLIHKKHHSHLKKRALLELLGFAIILGVTYTQRKILLDAFEIISEVEIGWFVLLLAMYWVMLPLTGLSYRLLTPLPNKFDLTKTMLAHMAGAGPGRIIPGGIGGMSISALHLKKMGLTIEQAISVVLTNNVIGLAVNTALLIATLIVFPDTLPILTSNISSQHMILVMLGTIAVLTIIQWLMHARNTKKEAKKTFRAWRKTINMLLSRPIVLIGSIGIALIIVLIHTAMLDLSSYALNYDLSYIDALIALSFGIAVGGILPTPGGVGGVEAGIITTLILLGTDPAAATSIALLFRIATYGQPLIPGTIAYLYLRKHQLL